MGDSKYVLSGTQAAILKRLVSEYRLSDSIDLDLLEYEVRGGDIFVRHDSRMGWLLPGDLDGLSVVLAEGDVEITAKLFRLNGKLHAGCITRGYYSRKQVDDVCCCLAIAMGEPLGLVQNYHGHMYAWVTSRAEEKSNVVQEG